MLGLTSTQIINTDIVTGSIRVEQHNSDGTRQLVFSHIKELLMIQPLNLRHINVNIIHYTVLAVIYSFFCYAYYLVKLCLELRAGQLLKNIIIPTFPLVGCITIIGLSFLAGKIYGEFLGIHKFKNYYLVLLSGGYLPICIILSHFVPLLTLPLYLIAGVASEYFIRQSLLKNTVFESQRDKVCFTIASICFNLFMWGGIFPQFFTI